MLGIVDRLGHHLPRLVEELPEGVREVDWFLGLLDDAGAREGGVGDGEGLARSGAVDGGDAAQAVVVAGFVALALAEGRGGAEGGGLLSSCYYGAAQR